MSKPFKAPQHRRAHKPRLGKCPSGKIAFRSYDQAWDFIRDTRASPYKYDDVHLSKVYDCDRCPYYHTSSQNRD